MSEVMDVLKSEAHSVLYVRCEVNAETKLRTLLLK
jgi:hypothetical protein